MTFIANPYGSAMAKARGVGRVAGQNSGPVQAGIGIQGQTAVMAVP